MTNDHAPAILFSCALSNS